MGEQTLVQLAGEQRDAVSPRVVPEPAAGEASLAAAAGSPDTSLNTRWIEGRYEMALWSRRADVMVEPDPRASRLNELRLRLPGLVRGIQEPGITRERKSELAAEYEQVLGAVLALADELDVRTE
jgi:hypothetical protein